MCIRDRYCIDIIYLFGLSPGFKKIKEHKERKHPECQVLNNSLYRMIKFPIPFLHSSAFTDQGNRIFFAEKAIIFSIFQDELLHFICRSRDEEGIISVSYTHLRAHETPEQLVCRLLLEIKKYR